MNKTMDVNAITNEEVIRDMTEDEQANYDQIISNQVNLAKQEAAKVDEKAALLERLGITADEAALLLG